MNMLNIKYASRFARTTSQINLNNNLGIFSNIEHLRYIYGKACKKV
jgi:hypothetical protein